MKKIVNFKKIIMLVLVVCLSLSFFVGFTYPQENTKKILSESMNPYTSIYFAEGMYSVEGKVPTGHDVNFSLKYAGNIVDAYVNGVKTTAFAHSSGYGYSSMRFHFLADGIYDLKFRTDGTIDGSYLTFNAKIQVGEGVLLSNACYVQFYDSSESSGNLFYSYSQNIGAILKELPTIKLDYGKKVVGWQFWNNNLQKWEQFSSSLLPQVTPDKLFNNVLKVAVTIEEIPRFNVTYMRKVSGFLGIKSWKEFAVEEVLEGGFFPDYSQKFGSAFISVSSDKEGKKVITLEDKVLFNTTVYINEQKVPDTVAVEYYSYMMTKDYDHFKTVYVPYGQAIDLSLKARDYIDGFAPATAVTYKFSHWSTDANGKNTATPVKAQEGQSIKLYAQYEGMNGGSNSGGALGFFQDINDNLLEPVNAWWGIENVVLQYAVTIFFYLLFGALIYRIIVMVITHVSGSKR